jgi:hypothetical protein
VPVTPIVRRLGPRLATLCRRAAAGGIAAALTLRATIRAAAAPRVAAGLPIADMAADFNAHMLQPFLGVARIVVILGSVSAVLQRVWSHHREEHWGHAIIGPLGLGVAGFGIVELAKTWANEALGGTLGF